MCLCPALWLDWVQVKAWHASPLIKIADCWKDTFPVISTAESLNRWYVAVRPGVLIFYRNATFLNNQMYYFYFQKSRFSSYKFYLYFTYLAANTNDQAVR